MQTKVSKRRLYSWEIAEFYPVFAASLNYEKVWVHENNPWPDRIDRLGRRFKGMPPPGDNDHNAITLGNHTYFPVQLPTYLPSEGDADLYKIDWLIHELTHAWQYQHIGWRYLLKALLAQFRDKERAYDYGGEEGLIKSREEGKKFHQYNPEQQGNIVQAYYLRRRGGQDVSAWQPYIDDLQSGV